MHFVGKPPLDPGRRDLAILVMFGSTGLMMDLVILSFFKFVSHPSLSFQLSYFLCAFDMDCKMNRLFMQLAEDLGALPIWVFNNGTDLFLI